MKTPHYSTEKYHDQPPYFKSWRHIYALVLAQFTLSIFLLRWFTDWNQ